MFPLQIFPEGSLSESVITPVWIGVMVISFFNQRLGWTFSGLVVPGYLVPIMIAKPLAAIVVVAEGCITFLLIRFISERLSEKPGRAWSSLFGRDRFLALVICSLVVRIVLDGWLLPIVGEVINHAFHVEFDYRNNLCSFGLIIVALISNQFWKTGLLKGMVPFCISIGLTYVIVRYVLMEFTNFNIGSLEFMYESISSSLLASPKAYIILITSAILASRMNLLYGWDFNGVLIPSLLALQWYQPMKIVTSIIEACVILIVAGFLLRTPWFRDKTIEGARKLLLFFNISFGYKFLIAHLCNGFGVVTPVSEFYGFGYLLSTLVAVKMHNMNSVTRFLRSTTQMSLVGALAANLLGFLLTFSPELWKWTVPRVEALAETDSGEEGGNLIERLRLEKLRMYERRTGRPFVLPLPQELDLFTKGLQYLDRFRDSGSATDRARAESLLAEVGYGVREFDRLLYLSEWGVSRGWGVYVLRPEARDGITVEVPAPLDEWAVMESGVCLFREFEGGALAIAGSARKAGGDSSSDVLANPATFFHAFHRQFSDAGVLQVRGYGDRSLAGLSEDGLSEGQVIGSGLWMSEDFPEQIQYAELKKLIGVYRLQWGRTPHRNLQRADCRAGFGELVLDRKDRRRLLSLAVVDAFGSGEEDDAGTRSKTLVELIAEIRDRMPKRGSDAYRSAHEEELLYLDAEVVVPLFNLARNFVSSAGEAAEFADSLRILATAARSIGYDVQRVLSPDGELEYLALVEVAQGERRRNWGTYVFRLGDAQSYLVQVPRPLLEANTIAFSIELFRQLDGRLLAIAGAHPLANVDGSADLIRLDNKVSLFNSIAQTITRETGEDPLLITQLRAFGRDAQDRTTADAFVAFASGRLLEDDLGRLGLGLFVALGARGVDAKLVDGSPDTAGYEAYGISQSRYASFVPGKEFCAVWVSPRRRAWLANRSGSDYEERRFSLAGVSTVSSELPEFLRGLRLYGPLMPQSRVDLDLLSLFLDTRDPFALERVVRDQRPGTVTRLVDSLGQAWLVLAPDGEGLALIAKLHGAGSSEAEGVFQAPLSEESLRAFASSQARLMRVIEDSN